MNAVSATIAASAAALALAGAAFAQDSSTQAQEIQLPEACQTGAAPGMAGMEGMQPSMEGMGEIHQAYMQGMMATQDEMMQGVMAEDPDVGFACGMMAHHQAAINMARVELENGGDEKIKSMAQKIIEDQQREIDEFKAWLEEQAQ